RSRDSVARSRPGRRPHQVRAAGGADGARGHHRLPRSQSAVGSVAGRRHPDLVSPAAGSAAARSAGTSARNEESAMSDGRESLTLVWFRDDLRVDDHEALTAARADGRVVGIWLREYRDASDLGPRPLGGAARWWAHESLRVLEAELSELGIPLLFAAGRDEDIDCQVVDELGIDSVRWSRSVAPASRSSDARIEARLTEAGVAVHSHPGAVLVEPWTTSPQGGDFYKVFTPFFKATRDHEVGQVLPAPNAQTPPSDSWLESARAHDWASDLDGLGLLDGTATGSGDFASARTPPWWQTTVAEHWSPGCRAAAQSLRRLAEGVDDYADS